MKKQFEEWHWEITRRCNLRCLHCIADCGLAGRDELSTKNALLAVSKMAKLGCKRIMITGGEPLVRRDIVTVLKACKAQGMNLRLITNGFDVDRHLMAKLSSLLEVVGVSLDGATRTTHDAVRGKGSFDRACRTISVFSYILPVSVHITVSGQNIHDLEAIIKKAFELGACHVHVSEISLLGRALKNEKWFALSQNQKNRLREIAEGMAPKKSDLCVLDLSTVYLSYDGLVYPCTEIAFKKSLRFIADILSESCVENLLSSSGAWVSPAGNCCYVTYEGAKIFFCLESEHPCCMIGGVKP